MITERKLMENFIAARGKKDKLEEELSDAEKELDTATDELISYLDSIEATKTNFYPGLGSITIKKPTPQARITDQEQLFEDLRKIERDDLIKESVHTASLSSLIKELLTAFKPIPNGSTYYLKRTPMYLKDKQAK